MNNNIANGKLIINEFGNGFINIDKNITIYINKKNLNGAFNGEIVDVEYYKNDQLYYGNIINYSLINKIFVGKVDHFFYDNVYIYCNELGKSNLITIKTKLHLKKNDWIKVKIIFDDNNNLFGDILELLHNDIDIIIENKYKLNQIEATNLYNEDDDFIEENLHNYINQTNLNTFTIDPLNCMDCDDAFSIVKDGDKYNIFVHISDVSYYINPSKEIFDDVMMRGNTFYGKNKNWSMIPRIYANNICSILPNKKTRVVTNHFVYDPNEKDITKKLIYIKWFYSYIISKNKYDYDYIDSILDYNENCKILFTTSQIIKNIINDIDLSFDTNSHIMIKYWMIYVNQIMCNEIKKVYRYNPLPLDDKFELFSKYYALNNNEQLSKENRNDIINFINNHSNKLTFYLTKNLLTKAFYSTYISNESHYGIGINNYTHWTSPIRRSCDLLNHCILRGYHIDEENIEKYIKYMNEMEIIQDDIEKFIIQFNMYQNIKLNDIFEGTIIGVIKTGINVYIDDLDNKFPIHISKLSNEILNYDHNNKILKNIDGSIFYKLFDKIKVKVIRVDSNKIDFNIV
jgi:ribonuclease R